jgi:hypothetical protein
VGATVEVAGEMAGEVGAATGKSEGAGRRWWLAREADAAAAGVWEWEWKEKEKERAARSVKFNVFAECPRSGNQQKKLIKKYTLPNALDPTLGKDVFAECQLTSTRQSLPFGFWKTFAECPRLTVGKDYFAECHSLGTRQSIFFFFSFPNQTFCGMLLHYVDIHVPFWHNYKIVFYKY